MFSLLFQTNDGFHFNFSMIFFNLETMTSCHHIQNITLNKNPIFFTNLKYENYPNFYKLLLSLQEM